VDGISEHEKTHAETKKSIAQIGANNALTGGHVRNAERERECKNWSTKERILRILLLVKMVLSVCFLLEAK